MIPQDKRRYQQVKSGALKIATATEGELHRALNAATRLNDYEVAAQIEMELDRREDEAENDYNRAWPN